MAYAYSAALWIEAHTAVLTEILEGAGDPKIEIYDDSTPAVKLAEFIIDDAASAVSGTTGDLTIEIATQEDSALASGTASYAVIKDADGTVHANLDCQQGTSPVSGACVMNTLSIISGAPVDMLSVVIEAGNTIA